MTNKTKLMGKDQLHEEPEYIWLDLTSIPLKTQKETKK